MTDVLALLVPAVLDTLQVYTPPSAAAMFSRVSVLEVSPERAMLLNNHWKALPGPPIAVHRRIALFPLL